MKPLERYVDDLEVINMYLDEIATNIVDIVKVLGPGSVEEHINDMEKKILEFIDKKLY